MAFARLSPLSLLALPLLVSLGGCKDKQDSGSTEPLDLIPADIQGIYGRTGDDAPGMQVDASSVRFRQLSLVIHAGKMEGSTVRVERATLTWENMDEKTCNGTIARQGDRLLFDLFNDAGKKCDLTLEAAWRRWEPLAGMPEAMQGRYGVLLIEDKGMRLELDWVATQMTFDGIVELPDSNDERTELLIQKAKVVPVGDEQATGHECAGTMKLVEGQLETDFWVPLHLLPTKEQEEKLDEAGQAAKQAHIDACNAWDGSDVKWTVDASKLPKAPIANAKATLTITPELVTLKGAELECEQPLHRTQSVATGAFWAEGPGGERLSLGRAEPLRVSEECKLKIEVYCRNNYGETETEAIEGCVTDTERNLCPGALYLREISDVRYKVGLEPDWINQVACVDTIEDFVVAQK